MYASTIIAQAHMLTLKFQPSSRFSSKPIAYIEMPEDTMVMAAKEIALKPRVFSSNRSRRYSGTERALEP